MEAIILVVIGLMALAIICFRARKLVDTVSGKEAQSSCDCGMCSKSCSSREISDRANNSNRI